MLMGCSKPIGLLMGCIEILESYGEKYPGFVVIPNALVSPPLRHGGQLIIPFQLVHVCGRRLF